MSTSYCVMKEWKMINLKLGETNVKMNQSACPERGTTKRNYHLSFLHHTVRHRHADHCSMQDACQIWTYNHGQKSWESCIDRTLFNTREILSARYWHCTSLPPPPTPRTVLKPSRHNSFDLSTLYWVGRGKGTWICKNTALLFTRKLVKLIELKLRSDCPKEFCPWL